MLKASANGSNPVCCDLIEQLEQQDVEADPNYYASLLRICTKSRDLFQGKRVHARILGSEHHRDRYLGNLLVEMYGKCGSLVDARVVFDNIQQPNAFSWNIMIAAYTQNGYLEEARSLFGKMPHRDVVSWNAMIAAYAQNGHLRKATDIFEQMPTRNAVSWASMVTAYAQNGQGKQAIRLFLAMDLEGVQPKEAAFVSVLDACAALVALKLAKLIHVEIIAKGFASNVVVGTALVNMYGKCGSIKHAWNVFEKMDELNAVSWTTMIAAYAQNGHLVEARTLFERMPNPDIVSWTCMITTYADHGLLQEARSMFEGMPIHSVVSWNAMITAYTQNGYLTQARELFDGMTERDATTFVTMITAYAENHNLEEATNLFEKMPQPNLPAWNVLIGAYAQNGLGKESIRRFNLMDLEGIQPNEISLVSVLNACAVIPALTAGKMIHDVVVDDGFELNVAVGTSLINMYTKCGSFGDARMVFENMAQHDVISWTAIILGYAQNGHSKHSLELFRMMCQEGIQPNEITYIGILSSCSHGGNVEESCLYFTSIVQDYGLTPILDHYICMIDLLGRAGWLDSAEDLISIMPFEADVVAWITLLGACKLHNDAERAARIAYHVLQLDPNNTTAYTCYRTSLLTVE